MLTLTQLPFDFNSDFDAAKKIARTVGLNPDHGVYNSTSTGLAGLFFGGQKEGDKRGGVIKTKEMGFLFVQDTEDLGLGNWFGMK